MPYLPRIVDAELRSLLDTQGAVVIEGPKACGKTETARQVAGSEVLLDVDANARTAAELDPSLVLSGERPRLIDKWQLAPAIWNHVRRRVDDDRAPGAFVLTGSATPADDLTRHTGAGRFARLPMRPMSLAEAGLSSRQVSLAGLLAGERTACPEAALPLVELAEEIVRGGWPASRDLAVGDATRSVRGYLDQIRRTDIRAVDGRRRDPERVRAALASLARNTASQARRAVLARDAGVSEDAVASYVDALTSLGVVEVQPAWRPHLRSSHQLRTTPTWHFVDPSLAAAALGATPAALVADLETFGLLFESLVVRDLRVYGQAEGGEVLHYRDQSGLEVDAVVTRSDGAWAAIEVKLGAAAIDAAAESLKAFAGRVDTAKVGSPRVLAVVVPGGYGYVRQDGVHVVPLAALAP